MTPSPFTVGADVELFLRHRQQGLIPATSFNCPGTKLEPINIGADVGTFHRDNLSVEIQPLPAATPKEFVDNSTRIFEAVAARFVPMGLRLYVAATVEFHRGILDKIQEAGEIGCDPDFCAYTGEKAEATSAKKLGSYRTGSGHIHVGGIESMSDDDRRQVIQWLDVFEGLYCRAHENMLTPMAHVRRRYYGQAGRYRTKPYGVEWRTPSALNWQFWTTDIVSAASLFASIYCAIGLVRQDTTVESVGNPVGIRRMRESIDGNSRVPIRRRMAYWQELLSEVPECRAIIKQSEKLYGQSPGLYASGG